MMLFALFLTGCREKNWGTVAVMPSLEDTAPDGSLYTPSTQSFLRGEHWLETVQKVEIITGDNHTARFEFNAPGDVYSLEVVNLPLEYLVPRLNYTPADPPDAFDGFNLMLAEYSRNSMSVPVGKPGDATAHFETTLVEDAPWTLVGDFQFSPNSTIKPIRVGVINNCLAPGLWELNASDRSGEIYHAWFTMPATLYNTLVARANGVDEAFAADATRWSTEPVLMDLNRLRTVQKTLGRCALTLHEDAEAGYSTQDSRRKLAKRYALVEKDGDLQKPQRRIDLTSSLLHLSNFVEPGKYAVSERRAFDLAFLADVGYAEVNRVTPLTDYKRFHRPSPRPASANYLELTLYLEDLNIVIGNLPMALLVPQEDFAIHGFGVGVLSSNGLAERRQYLIKEGPAPSFAYLFRETNGQKVALNSHDYGIEQIFIRTHINDDDPWWEITITSFERIVDIIKYRVRIPDELHQELATNAMEYIAPLYRTYRDDNLR
ncbi:MAG: hypothetical protein ACE5G0_18065 [Rhodothermales bacterium]